MKHLATVALMLNLGVAGVYAEQKPVKMRASGTVAATTINLQPNTNTDEQNLTGDGTLGPFTFRELHAGPVSPSSQPPSTCEAPTHLYFPEVAGGGVFRFQDGNLLTVVVTAGSSLWSDLSRQCSRPHSLLLRLRESSEGPLGVETGDALRGGSEVEPQRAFNGIFSKTEVGRRKELADDHLLFFAVFHDRASITVLEVGEDRQNILRAIERDLAALERGSGRHSEEVDTYDD